MILDLIGPPIETRQGTEHAEKIKHDSGNAELLSARHWTRVLGWPAVWRAGGSRLGKPLSPSATRVYGERNPGDNWRSLLANSSSLPQQLCRDSSRRARQGSFSPWLMEHSGCLRAQAGWSSSDILHRNC